MGLEIDAMREIEGLKSEIGAGNPAGGELSNGGDSIAISLLDLAEILDQHKIWVESGGESGVKADLCGVNLAKADLMGANLYGAEGLWFGRLGGTNLFDSVLPDSISAVDSSKAIGDATKIVRWFYFFTVGVSLLCCALIAFTTDVRLLLNSSAVPWLRLANVLPMTGLYLGGQLVLLVLSLRFHFLLLRLWGSMAALPAVFPDGQTLEK